jgi:hypothetical protein
VRECAADDESTLKNHPHNGRMALAHVFNVAAFNFYKISLNNQHMLYIQVKLI